MTDKYTQKQSNIFEIPDSIIPKDKRLFIPNWDNKPPIQKTIIKTQGNRILTTGNLLALVSKPGTGKSSICEAIISNLLNSNCDSLGFEVSLHNGRDKVLYIDTERTLQDTWNSWERTYKRAKIEYPNVDNRLIFANFKAISINERKSHLESILNDNKDIGLVIFDGAGDFVRDTNSIQETGEFIDWINSFNSNISIFVTLHTNLSDNKPRGHLGSELCRRAESVLLVRKLDDGIREITTEFEHGKVRNDNDLATSYYKYSDETSMFISIDHIPKKAFNVEKEQDYKLMAEKIFEGKTILSSSYIIKEISNKTEKTLVASKGIFHRHFIGYKLVQKTSEGYKLT